MAGLTPTEVRDAIELVRRIREFSDAPVVFYTYYNLVFANGVDAYFSAARAAGVDGILTLDLPPEEAGEFAAALDARRNAARAAARQFYRAATKPWRFSSDWM